MAKCAGKGWDFCDSCINAEHDPFTCEDCEDGDLWEGFDTDEELTVHELKFMTLKEAA